MSPAIGSRPTRNAVANSSASVPANGVAIPARSYLWVPRHVVPAHSRPYDWIKSATDRCTAFTLLVAALPVMLAVAVAVKLTSRGPAIYSQVRVGRLGRPYWIYKFRSMYLNCEALTGARWCVKNDSRVTPFGRIIRRFHLDELPQLWNVVRGEMSIIGPRPERPEFVGSLEESIAGYRGRLDAKPGITGLAQIQLPSDSSIESVRRKLVLDLCYVERYGFWLDVRIVVGTVLYLLGVSYAGIRRLLALPTGQAPDVVITHRSPESGC